MATDHAGIAGIVVTYFPEFDALHRLLNALIPQVDLLVLVDNGSGLILNSWLSKYAPSSLIQICLEENIGLAAAQNLGITEARRRGMEFILLSDQDSLPAPTMVHQLITALRNAQVAGCRVAAAGPRYHDAHQVYMRPFVQIHGLRVLRFDCKSAVQVFQVDHLISSGSLIPLAVIDDIGPMKEELFIDFIDTEWCLRAWRKGYTLLGVCSATMEHSLGERTNNFFGRHIPVHVPLRHYFLFRNAIWLLKDGGMPLGWKFATLRRLLLTFGYFALLGPQRLTQAHMMLKGLHDGLTGHLTV